MKRGKKYVEKAKLVQRSVQYDLGDAVDLVLKTTVAKFDETVECHIRLGVDSRHADQQVRGAVILPHGTGKKVRVLVFAKGDRAAEAEAAGAEFVGAEELVTKIQSENWFDYDMVVATPDMMGVVGRLGRVLGPKGLMPNPKAGTVTADVGKAVTDIKAGKIGQLTLCGKTNVLTFVFGLWERAFHEIAVEYPDVKTDYCHVDATTMWMVKNPEWFDVIVTENLFGDIITDLGAMTQGGMGIAAGGNINPKGLSMFEPIGGSAPKYTGLNVINPMAAICAGAMMLDTLGESKAAKAIENAVAQFTPKMKSQAAGKMGFSTTEVGDEVAKLVK